jgi:hypothetical protein
MKINVLGLLLAIFLLVPVIQGLIRKLKGGPFLPTAGADGDHNTMDRNGRRWQHKPETVAWTQADGDRNVMDRNGRWWRYEPETGAWTEVMAEQPVRQGRRMMVRGLLIWICWAAAAGLFLGLLFLAGQLGQ